jgi:phospholipase/carboxylesterase
MPRFFRRLAEGVFDDADVRRRAGDLAGFVAEARAAYGLAAPIAVGFSNGANIAAALMMLDPGVLAGAVLIRPMRPLADAPKPQAGAPILMLTGAFDPLVTVADAAGLAASFAAAGAAVRHETVPAGHQLTRADLDLATGWLAERPSGSA